MRLWHKDLIPVLPRKQLLGQWRECCLIAKNLNEKGTPNHILVNKVQEYMPRHFIYYSRMIYTEMNKRGYKVDWANFTKYYKFGAVNVIPVMLSELFKDWHNDRYLRQCLYNLQEKYDCGAITAEEWKRITDRWPEYK